VSDPRRDEITCRCHFLIRFCTKWSCHFPLGISPSSNRRTLAYISHAFPGLSPSTSSCDQPKQNMSACTNTQTILGSLPRASPLRPLHYAPPGVTSSFFARLFSSRQSRSGARKNCTGPSTFPKRSAPAGRLGRRRTLSVPSSLLSDTSTLVDDESHEDKVREIIARDQRMSDALASIGL
jgi:hypothetical protein